MLPPLFLLPLVMIVSLSISLLLAPPLCSAAAPTSTDSFWLQKSEGKGMRLSLLLSCWVCKKRRSFLYGRTNSGETGCDSAELTIPSANGCVNRSISTPSITIGPRCITSSFVDDNVIFLNSVIILFEATASVFGWTSGIAIVVGVVVVISDFAGNCMAAVRVIVAEVRAAAASNSKSDDCISTELSVSHLSELKASELLFSLLCFRRALASWQSVSRVMGARLLFSTDFPVPLPPLLRFTLVLLLLAPLLLPSVTARRVRAQPSVCASSAESSTRPPHLAHNLKKGNVWSSVMCYIVVDRKTITNRAAIYIYI